VATAAVFAEASGVFVLTTMACDTFTGVRGAVVAKDGNTEEVLAQAFFGRACVATIAGNNGVRTAQHKTGLRVVIELPRLPGRRIVASVALLAERTAMRIVACVAGDTVGPGVVECRRLMAIVTRYLRVRTEQRKAHQVMVEPYVRSPVGRDVAACALRAQLPVMCGVIRVAAGAASRYCSVHVALVTGVTFERRMPLRQLQIGVACMIKCCRAPTGSNMAARAIGTVAAFVHIVGAMTGDATVAIRTAEVSNFASIAAAVAILAS